MNDDECVTRGQLIPFSGTARETICAGPGKEYRQGCHEIKNVQFDHPSAEVISGKHDVAMRDQHRHQHIESHNQSSDPRLITNDHEDGRDYFTDKVSISNVLRKAGVQNHILHMLNAVDEAVTAVKDQ